MATEPEGVARGYGDMCRKDFDPPTGQDEEEALAEGASRAVSATGLEGITSTCGKSFCLRAINSLPLLAQVEQQMKFVGDLERLGCPFFCRSGILSPSVAANDFNFRVGLQPGGDGLLSPVWKHLDGLPSLKVDQQSTVDLALFPRPVIHAQNPDRLRGRAGHHPQTTKQRRGRNEHPQRRCQSP